MKIDKEGIIQQVMTFTEGHAAALDLILGAPDPAMPALIGSAANRIADELDAGNEDTATMLRWVIGGFPDGQADFWLTPVGQAVYAIAGYGREVVPRVQAAAILNISRQRVGQLEEDDVLVSHWVGDISEGLTEASVRARWEAFPPKQARPEALDKDAQAA